MIEPGQMLAHYKLVEKIGEGGMGMVWKALDTTLSREAAIKILPDAFAQDPDRRGRFEREAKLLATLNHPGIAGIYGLHEDGGVHFIAMEFVPGEDLSQRLARGPLAVEDALDVARQVAEALEAAHEQGVIHRDLKPANITRTPEGKIKVLDLGLAKALANETADDSVSLSLSPTVTSAGTVAGTLLGTAAYMSPEQVKGKEADRRADIWAFGCVLFEMLTGRVTFPGETISEVMASVLRDRPDEGKLPPETPPAVRHLLQRCLDPDRDTRLRDIGEARIALSPAGLASTPVSSSAGLPGAVSEESKSRRLPWVVGLVLLAAAAATGGWLARGDPAPSTQEVRASILPPAGFQLAGNNTNNLSVSPDGTKLTFTATTGSGRPSLYLRVLGAEQAQELPGTGGATYPFWSPDSRQIGFFAEGKLKKIDLDGGAPMTLTNAPDARGGTWNVDGTILFAPETQVAIHRVSSGGAPADPVTQVDTERKGETSHRHPYFLPDGRHFLYLRVSHSAAGADDVNSVWVGNIETGETSELMQAGTQATYAQGHLFWVRERFLMARPFSVDRLDFTGDAFVVGEGIVVADGAWRAAFTVSEAGPLAFLGGSAIKTALSMVNRKGEVLGTIGEEASYGFIRISPDDRKLAATMADGVGDRSDLWIYDIARDVGTRLTFHDAQDNNPVWSPDGKRIAFASNRGGKSDIYVRPANGSGEAELLYSGRGNSEPESWSPDGKQLLFNCSAAKYDLCVLDVETGTVSTLISTPFDEGYARFSPDGKWVAYLSNESGRYDLYLTRYPTAEGKWQLTKDGSDWLLGWNDAGNEIYLLDQDGGVAAIKVRLGTQVVVEPLEKLFPIRANQAWAHTSDGERFIVPAAGDNALDNPITLVLDWEHGTD